MSASGGEHGLDQFGQRGAIALQRALETEPLADRHDRHAVPAEVAAQQDRVAGLDPGGRDLDALRHPADAGGVDEDAVALAAIDDLRVAGDDPHAGRPGGLGHRSHDAAKRFHRQPLFEDEARAEVGRLGPGHRQVVDRSADGQRADVAAGKEQRVDDEAVGGEGQPRAGGRQHGGVVRGRRGDEGRGERGEGTFRCTERRQEHALDQVPHQPAAAAVRHLHGGVVAQGNGAVQVEIVAHGCFFSSISAQIQRTSCHSCGETS